MFCGDPDVEIPRWWPSETPLAHTVTGISFFKERGWDGQMHEATLSDAAMKRRGVLSGVINTVSNHDHNTAFNRVAERTALELMSHRDYTNSLGTVVQILFSNTNIEELVEANLLRGCDPDALRSLYDRTQPQALERDDALRDRLISILTFGQCTKMVQAMERGCLHTQSFLLRRLLDHIYTNALSGSAGYYYVNGDDIAKLAINSIFVRADGSPVQSSIVLYVFNGTLETSCRNQQLLSYISSLFVDACVDKLLSKPFISYDHKKIEGLKDRRDRPLKSISYLDVLSVLDGEGKDSLLSALRQFVINSLSASAEHLIRTGGTSALELIGDYSTSQIDGSEISIQAMFNFVMTKIDQTVLLAGEYRSKVTIANYLLRVTPIEDTYFQSKIIAKYLDAYNIFPTINGIIRSSTGFSEAAILHSFQINDSIVAFLKFDGNIPYGKLEITICNLNPGVTYYVDATDMKHLAVWLQQRYFSERHHIESWEDFARDHMGTPEFTHVFDAIMSPTSVPGEGPREVIVHLAPGVSQGFQQEGYRFITHHLDQRKLVKILMSAGSGIGIGFLEVLEQAREVTLPPNGLTIARRELLSERDLADKFAETFNISVHKPRDVDVLLELRGIKLPNRNKGCLQVSTLDISLAHEMYSIALRYLSPQGSRMPAVVAIPSVAEEIELSTTRCMGSRRDAEFIRQYQGHRVYRALREAYEDNFVLIYSVGASVLDPVLDLDPRTEIPSKLRF